MNSNPLAKRILCYGDSNTRGFVPGSMGKERFNANGRWTGVLQNFLGTDYEVIEEGLDGRTTAYDDPRPGWEHRNGAEYLHIFLESHKPIDLLIIMLGTTDTKEIMNLTGEQIAEGLEKVVNSAVHFSNDILDSQMEILIISPAVVKEEAEFASKLFIGATEKCESLAKLYKNIADKFQCFFMDANEYVTVDLEEGVHLGKEAHKELGDKIFNKVKAINL